MRLDSYLVEKEFFTSRTRAKFAIDNNKVLVNKKFCKASYDVLEEDIIEIIDNEEYVSLGKFKLEKALKDFLFMVDDKNVVDIGASNGGFTQVLLENNAKKVFAVDVGENQLDKNLVNNNKVVVMDNTNAKNLTRNDFKCDIDLIVVDVSFISLKHILPVCSNILDNGKHVITLIKPQFEVGKKKLNKNGIVTNEKDRENVIKELEVFAKNYGLHKIDLTQSPNRGKDKNMEYLCLYRREI